MNRRWYAGGWGRGLLASWGVIAGLSGLVLMNRTAVADSGEHWQEPTQLATARWGVPPPFSREQKDPIAHRWGRRLTGYVQVRDGVELRYSVLLPKGKGPFPVIINYSGYDPGAIGGFSYEHDNSAMSTDLDATLLEHGYAILGVNARGTGCSTGTFDFLGPAYGQDGADVVEWAAKQPWSTGSVGMANWSWAGMSQVATASERPAHLKAIAPGMALTDPRLDSWAIGGVPSQGFVTGWWMFLHSRWLAVRKSAEQEHDQRCLMQVERNYDSGEAAAVNLPSQLIRHPLRDDWMERRTILNKAEQITVPVLSMESFQDEATTARAGYYQERVNPSLLWYVQTNGDHDLYESMQFRTILLSFLDHFVKGAANGFEQRPHVEIWQETSAPPGSQRPLSDRQARSSWIITRPQLPVATSLLRLRLESGHRLSVDDAGGSTGRSGSEPDSYRYPVEGPGVNDGFTGARWGDLQQGWREGSVTYTTAALPEDVVIYGPASADLWVSSTLSDTDVQVTLTEVRPDGGEVFVQRGWLRMSARGLNTSLSTDTRPWPCDEPGCIQALSPGVPALGRVELTKVSHAFRKGSRIRIWIDAPSATGGNSFDHSSLPSTNQIWHDDAHPSQLVLGVLADVAVPAKAVSCGAASMQPCRRDPLAEEPQGEPTASAWKLLPQDAPRVELVMQLVVTCSNPIPMGGSENSKDGKRTEVWPILGGRFEGKGIRGSVLAGGGDFPLLRPDGVEVIDALYRLRTDDGVTIIIHNRGLAYPSDQKDDWHYRLAPEFTAPVGKYQWLNSHLFIANLVDVPASMRLARGANENDRLIQVYEVL